MWRALYNKVVTPSSNGRLLCLPHIKQSSHSIKEYWAIVNNEDEGMCRDSAMGYLCWGKFSLEVKYLNLFKSGCSFGGFGSQYRG